MFLQHYELIMTSTIITKLTVHVYSVNHFLTLLTSLTKSVPDFYRLDIANRYSYIKKIMCAFSGSCACRLKFIKTPLSLRALHIARI